MAYAHMLSGTPSVEGQKFDAACERLGVPRSAIEAVQGAALGGSHGGELYPREGKLSAAIAKSHGVDCTGFGASGLAGVDQGRGAILGR